MVSQIHQSHVWLLHPIIITTHQGANRLQLFKPLDAERKELPNILTSVNTEGGGEV